MDANSTWLGRSHCNHGYRDSVLGCICDDGWTGLSDFSIIDGLHCDINTKAVTGLFCLVLCTNTLCMMVVVRYLVVRFIDKRSFCILTLTPLSMFPVLILAAMAACSLFAITKIVYQDRQIVGRDLFITILVTLFPSLAQVGVVFYFFVVIKYLMTHTSIMTDERRTLLKGRFRFLSNICLVIPPMSIISCLMPLISLGYPESMIIFARIFHIGVGLTAWLYGILTALAIKYLLFELQSHVDAFPQSSDDMLLVVKRLRWAYFAIVHNTFFTGFYSILFGACDYFLARSIFIFLLAIFAIPIGASALMWTVSKVPNNQTTISVKRRDSQIFGTFLLRQASRIRIPTARVIPILDEKAFELP